MTHRQDIEEQTLKALCGKRTKTQLMRSVLDSFDRQELMITLLKILTDDNASAASKHFARLKTHDLLKAYQAGLDHAESLLITPTTTEAP